MLGHELAVEKREIADLQTCDQPRERDFRCVGSPAEHALSEEGAPELYAVETADQLTPEAYLDRMGVAGLMERKHGPLELELGVDPGLLAIGASGDDRREFAVVGHFETAGAQRSPERAREVEAVERKDRPVARLDPEQLGRIAAVGHREDPGGITLQQQARVEATHESNMGPSNSLL